MARLEPSHPVAPSHPAAPAVGLGRSVAGLDGDELVARFGSPLYVYDAAVLRARVAALRDALPTSVDIAFATKANLSPGCAVGAPRRRSWC